MIALARRMNTALRAGASWLNPPQPPMDARRWLFDAVMPLEDRIMLDAEPVATIAPVGSEFVLLGESFTLNVTFDNVPDGDAGSDVGYRPYVDLYIPHLGLDGVNGLPADGVEFIGATYLGNAVQATLLTFDAGGQATHPFAHDASGQARVLSGDPGDQVVVLQLPFGSFTAAQPAITMAVEFELSPLADFAPDYVSANLEFQAQAGFALGRDPTSNPTVDPPVLQATPATQSITPTLIELTKISDAPKGETATGPNFVRTYTIDVNIADQQQVDSLRLTDLLSPNTVYLSTTITSGSGTIVQQPTPGAVVATGANELIVDFGSLVGGTGNEAQIQVQFYVNDLNGDTGVPVLDPATGASSTTNNDVFAEGVHVPLDPRDPQQPFVENITAVDNVIVNRSISMRKDVSIVVDRNVVGLSPGDVLSYTLEVDISDYFSFGNIILEDILSPGQLVDTSFIPQLVLTERGDTTSTEFQNVTVVGGQFSSNNITSTYNSVNGETTLVIDLSGEIIDQGLSGGDGVIEGGRTRIGDALLGVGPTMALLTFRTVVQANHPDGAGGVLPVDQGDRIGNRVGVRADVYPNGNPAGPPTGTATDDDDASLRVQTGGVADKSVVAVNGDTNMTIGPNGTPQITQGDTITFRLRYVLPTSSVSDFALVDFLPLPVLTATTLTQVATGTVPAVGEFALTASDSFSQLSGAPNPVVSFNADSNSIVFNYGTYSFQDQAEGNAPVTSVIDLLFTLRVNDLAFGDGLLLTNLVDGVESSSTGEQTISSAIAQFEVGEADVSIRKGIVDFAANGAPSYQGNRQPTGVSFDGATGNTATQVFTGLITDQALAAGLIDANLTDIDAGDKVTFAITVNNDGAGRNGAFDVRISDTLPAGFIIPTDASGLNLKVTYGDGTPVPYTLLAGGLFGSGIELVDGVQGALEADADAGGVGTTARDIVIITYDLVATPAVQPRQSWTNSTTVESFAGQEGGASLVHSVLTDTAVVTISPITASKVLTSTSETFTPGNDLAIGEVATFTLTYVLPEGQTASLVLADLLPSGVTGTLGNVNASIVSVGGAVSGAGVPAAGSAVTFDAGSNSYVANFGDVSVASNSSVADRTVVIEVSLRASDVPENVRGVTPLNQSSASYVTTNQDGSTSNHAESASAAVRLVIPDLLIGKSANPTIIVEAGQRVTYTLAIVNTLNAAGTTAFGISMTDSDLAALGFSNVTITGVTSTGAVNAVAVADAGGVVTVTADSLDNGGVINVTFTADSSPTLGAGGTLTNIATLDPYFTLSSASPDIAFARSITEAPVSATVTLLGASIDKSIVDTSIGNDINPLVQIGETVTYDLVITLPASVSPITLSDLAPAGLLLQSATLISIGTNTATGATAGGNITGSQLAVGANATISGNAFSMDFGTLTIAGDGSGVVTQQDMIVVRVTALVADIASNVGTVPGSLTQLTNSATVDYGVNSANDTVDVEVIEPDLVIDKVGASGLLQAGQTQAYTVTVTNNGPGTAYDLALSDLLDPWVVLSGPIVVTGAAGAAVGSYASFTDIPPITLAGLGSAFTVTYSAVVQDVAVLGDSIPNTINTTFDSLPGAGGRADSASDLFSFDVGGPSAVNKSIIWTSIGGDDDPNVQIGEVVRYRVVVTIPNGTMQLSISDTLAVGMDLVPGSVVLENFLGQPDPLFSFNSGRKTTQVDFGTVVNFAANPDDTIVFTMEATVLDVASNAAGKVLTNSATVMPGPLTPVTGTVDVVVIEPDVRVNKLPLRLEAEAGDTVGYLVEVRNAGNGIAFDIGIADPLAPQLILGPGRIEVFGPGAGAAAGSYDSFADIRVDQLAAGGIFFLRYEAIVLDQAQLGSSIVNTVTANYDSLPGVAQDGRHPAALPSDIASVPVTGPVQIVKSLVNSSIGNDASTDVQIGEVLTFRIVVTLPDGTTNLSIADTLPSGLAYVFGSFKTLSMFGGTPPVAALVEGGQTALLRFGPITNPAANPDNTVVLEIQGTVLDVPGNVAGTTLVNNAAVSTNIGQQLAEASVRIVDPVLAIDKSAVVNGGLQGDAGDLVTYSVVISNAAPTSTGDAYDYEFADNLPAGVVLVGTPTLSGSGAAGATLDLSLPNRVRVSGDSLLLGESLTITYTAQILDSAQVPGSITNTGTVDYDTNPGDGGADRSANSQATIFVTGDQGFTKTIVATTNPTTAAEQYDPTVTDVTIGETVTFNLIATLPEGTIGPVIITDSLLSANGTLSPVAGSYFMTVNGVTTALAPTLTDSNGDGIGDALSFDLGNVVIAGDGNPDNNMVLISYQAIVPDVAANQAAPGRVQAQPATLTTPLGTLGAGTNLEVVAPLLVATKTADVQSAAPGDIVTYTVTLRHTGDSTAAAQDLSFSDTLAGGRLVLVPGSLVVLSGPGSVGAGVTVDIPTLLLGQETTIQYKAILLTAAGTEPGSVVTNTAVAEFDSEPGAGGRPDSVSDSVDFTVPGFAKVILDTSNPDTGTGMATPGAPDLAIGETVTYTLTVTLAPGATNVTVRDTLLGAGGTGLLQLTATPSILLGAGLTATNPNPVLQQTDTDGDGRADALAWDFGAVTNGSGAPASITITVIARAQDIPAGTAPVGNGAGDILLLPASLDYGDGNLVSSVVVDIVEPTLVIDKSFTPTAGEAGDLISYRLTIGNNGLGPVYDLGLTDVADPGLILVGGYTLTQGGVTTTVASLDVLPLLRLMPGETVTVDYVQRISDAPLVESTLVNTATIGGDSLPGDDPEQRIALPATDTAAIVLTPTNAVQLVKTIPVLPTDDPNTEAEQFRPDTTDLTVGESATVFLKATLQRGTTGNVVISDALGSTEGLLRFKLGSVVASLGGVVLDPATYTVNLVDTNGDILPDQLVFSFGDIVIPGTVDPTIHTLDVRYDVQVPNLLRNQPGDLLDLPVLLDYRTGLGAASLVSGAGVDIVQGSPIVMKLSVKSEGDTGSLNGIGPAPDALSGTAGDVFTYTIFVQQTAGATGPDYDISLVDYLPSGMELVAGSAMVDIAGATLTTTANTVSVTLAELDLDQSFTVTYQARITDAALWNSTLTNEVYLDFDTVPGVGGRPGGSSDSFTITSFGEATIRTEVIATNNPNSGVGAVQAGVTDLGIGEQVTWRLTTTLNEGTTDSFIVTHLLPAGANGVIALQSLAAPVLGAGITAERSNPVAQLSDSDGDGLSDTIIWDFGRVTNTGDNIIDARDTITIDVVGIVPDDARNVQGDILDALSRVDFGTATGPGYDASGAPVAIVESELVIDKSVPPGDILPGGLITYTLRVSNASTALLAATDIVISDLLQPGLTLEGPIVIVSGPAGTTVNGTTVTVPLLPLGEEVVITYTARLAFELDPTQPVVNQAIVTWDSQPGAGGRPGEAEDSVVIDLLIPPTPTTEDEDAGQTWWIDERYIQPLAPTAIYSGVAQPGSRVVVHLPDGMGGMAQTETTTADAAGNWLVRASAVAARNDHHRYSIDDYRASTRLFASTDSLFDDHPNWADAPRSFDVSVGTRSPLFSHPVRIEAVQPAWALAGSDAMPVQLLHLPAQQGMLAGYEPLTVDKVMRELASESVAAAFARDQGMELGAVNRFNAHTLSAGAN